VIQNYSTGLAKGQNLSLYDENALSAYLNDKAADFNKRVSVVNIIDNGSVVKNFDSTCVVDCQADQIKKEKS
jgi:hypothetical protein